MKGGHGNVWGYGVCGLRVCFFIDWKVASKKCLKSGPEPSVSHYYHGHDNIFIANNDQITNAVNKFRNHPRMVMIKNKKKNDKSFFP